MLCASEGEVFKRISGDE